MLKVTEGNVNFFLSEKTVQKSIIRRYVAMHVKLLIEIKFGLIFHYTGLKLFILLKTFMQIKLSFQGVQGDASRVHHPYKGVY